MFRSPCSGARGDDAIRLLPSFAAPSCIKIQGWYEVHAWGGFSRGLTSGIAGEFIVYSTSEDSESIRWQQMEVQFTVWVTSNCCYIGITPTWAAELAFLYFLHLLLLVLVDVVLKTEELWLYHDGLLEWSISTQKALMCFSAFPQLL